MLKKFARWLFIQTHKAELIGIARGIQYDAIYGCKTMRSFGDVDADVANFSRVMIISKKSVLHDLHLLDMFVFEL
jgi:hypothetical protein